MDQWERLLELWAVLLQVPGPGHQYQKPTTGMKSLSMCGFTWAALWGEPSTSPHSKILLAQIWPRSCTYIMLPDFSDWLAEHHPIRVIDHKVTELANSRGWAVFALPPPQIQDLNWSCTHCLQKAHLNGICLQIKELLHGGGESGDELMEGAKNETLYSSQRVGMWFHQSVRYMDRWFTDGWCWNRDIITWNTCSLSCSSCGRTSAFYSKDTSQILSSRYQLINQSSFIRTAPFLQLGVVLWRIKHLIYLFPKANKWKKSLRMCVGYLIIYSFYCHCKIPDKQRLNETCIVLLKDIAL